MKKQKTPQEQAAYEAQRAAQRRQWAIDHPELTRKYGRDFYKRNREKRIAYSAAYYWQHREERRAYNYAYYRRKKRKTRIMCVNAMPAAAQICWRAAGTPPRRVPR